MGAPVADGAHLAATEASGVSAVRAGLLTPMAERSGVSQPRPGLLRRFTRWLWHLAQGEVVKRVGGRRAGAGDHAVRAGARAQRGRRLDGRRDRAPARVRRCTSTTPTSACSAPSRCSSERSSRSPSGCSWTAPNACPCWRSASSSGAWPRCSARSPAASASLLLTRLALGAVAATAGPAIASLTGDYFAADERGRGVVLHPRRRGRGDGLRLHHQRLRGERDRLAGGLRRARDPGLLRRPRAVAHRPRAAARRSEPPRRGDHRPRRGRLGGGPAGRTRGSSHGRGSEAESASPGHERPGRRPTRRGGPEPGAGAARRPQPDGTVAVGALHLLEIPSNRADDRRAPRSATSTSPASQTFALLFVKGHYHASQADSRAGAGAARGGRNRRHRRGRTGQRPDAAQRATRRPACGSPASATSAPRRCWSLGLARISASPPPLWFAIGGRDADLRPPTPRSRRRAWTSSRPGCGDGPRAR